PVVVLGVDRHHAVGQLLARRRREVHPRWRVLRVALRPRRPVGDRLPLAGADAPVHAETDGAVRAALPGDLDGVPLVDLDRHLRRRTQRAAYARGQRRAQAQVRDLLLAGPDALAVAGDDSAVGHLHLAVDHRVAD